MKNIAILLAAFVTALSLSGTVNAAVSVIVNDGTHDWEITTITGSFESINADSNTPSLTSQTWWGSETKAKAFAALVSDSLSRPNDLSNTTGATPYFAYGTETIPVAGVDTPFVAFITCVDSKASQLVCGNGLRAFEIRTPQSETWDFAVASKVSPVPVPAGLPLILTGIAGFAGLRMRNKRKAQV